MSTYEAIILGIIQGVTEFLPISSSGHLKLAQIFFGLENLDHYIIFDLFCHLGTLGAIFLVFYSDLKSDLKVLLQVVIGTLPLLALIFFIKPVKAIFNQPEYLGYFFIFTAIILYIGIKIGYDEKKEKLLKRRWRDPFIVGLFQVIAIFPGVSRSGTTISAARLLGWSKENAITFSFLLAIPAILGGTTYEILELFRHPENNPNLNVLQYFSGFITSLVVGYFSLILLIKMVKNNKLIVFVWYCLLLGIWTLYYFN